MSDLIAKYEGSITNAEVRMKKYEIRITKYEWRNKNNEVRITKCEYRSTNQGTNEELLMKGMNL